MNVLEEIFAFKREEIARVKTAEGLAELKARAKDTEGTRGFLKALQGTDRKPALIAEVKKASPVKGVTREDFDPVEIARIYEKAGASCLSVLTDEKFFMGSETNLRACREAVELPVLRKDFTTDEWHVYEARAMGADAILLIVNGLDDSELVGFRELAEELGMDVLVEAHNEEEADKAIESGAKILGINNRDLETFRVAVDVGVRVLPQYRDHAFLVSESALSAYEQVESVATVGAGAVLIGTTFCKADDIHAKVLEVMGW